MTEGQLADLARYLAATGRTETSLVAAALLGLPEEPELEGRLLAAAKRADERRRREAGEAAGGA